MGGIVSEFWFLVFNEGGYIEQLGRLYAPGDREAQTTAEEVLEGSGGASLVLRCKDRLVARVLRRPPPPKAAG